MRKKSFKNIGKGQQIIIVTIIVVSAICKGCIENYSARLTIVRFSEFPTTQTQKIFFEKKLFIATQGRFLHIKKTNEL